MAPQAGASSGVARRIVTWGITVFYRDTKNACLNNALTNDRASQIEHREIGPAILQRVLDKSDAIDPDAARMLELTPPPAGELSSVVNIIGRQFLGKGHMRVVRIRLLKSHEAC